jgi:hypothetical protein
MIFCGPACEASGSSIAEIFWRKVSSPSVTEYWRTEVPYFVKMLWAASAISFPGKSSGAGRPPAKEIMPGLDVIFNISRMAELFSPLILSAYIKKPPFIFFRIVKN